MKIGYARVSTTGQDYETQLAKLQAAGEATPFPCKRSSLFQHPPMKSQKMSLAAALFLRSFLLGAIAKTFFLFNIFFLRAF